MSFSLEKETFPIDFCRHAKLAMSFPDNLITYEWLDILWKIQIRESSDAITAQNIALSLNKFQSMDIYGIIVTTILLIATDLSNIVTRCHGDLGTALLYPKSKSCLKNRSAYLLALGECCLPKFIF